MLDSVRELMTRAEAVMRKRIAEVPDGIYYAEGYLDNNGHEPEPLLARLKLTIAGARVVADFSGSSPQTAGPTNVGPAMAFNALALTVKAFLDPRSPVNHGSFEPLEIVNPSGSFLNATLPAPCGGMVECRSLMVSLIASALGQALPERRTGDLKGGANHVYLSGPGRGGDMFLLYEYPAGGTGATATNDGNHGTRAWPDGDFNAVWGTEVLEAQCPVEVVRYGIREGSGGEGAHAGGHGIRRELRILGEGASLSVLSDKNLIPPYGVAGGGSGACNRFVVIRDGEVIDPSSIPGKVGGFPLRPGDVVRIESAGGGGWGDALERDASQVAGALRQGYLSPAQAAQGYGVQVDAFGAVDKDATRCTRAQLADARVMLPVTLADADRFDGSRRLLTLPDEIARRIEATDGDLVELSTPQSASSLRAWLVQTEGGAASKELSLGPVGLSILGVREGDCVHMRRLSRARTSAEVGR